MADNNQIDPQQLQQLPQGQPQGIFPNPLLQAQAPPSGLDQLTQAALGQAQFGQQQMGQTLGRQRALGDEVSQLRAQQQQLAPNLSYHPQMAPITGQGFGHNLLNLLGDIGKGALSAGAYGTNIGRAVQEGIYSQPRQQYADLANRIKEIQGQSEIEKGVMEPEAQMGYHPMYSAVRGAEAGAELPIKQMNADTQRIVANNSAALHQKALQIQQDLGNKKITVEQARTQMMKYVADSTNAMRNQVAGMFTDQRQAAVETEAAETQYKTEADHLLQTILGIGPSTPTQPAINKGATQQNPRGSNKQQGKGTVTLTSGGKRYNIPRHLIGAFKKDHPDAR